MAFALPALGCRYPSALRRALLALCLAGAALAAAAPLPAQQPAAQPAPDTLYELRLGDGTRHIGTVVARDDDRIIFLTANGVRLEVDRAFARLRPAAGRVVQGEFWPDDRNPSRLFFAPTARTLDPGHVYAGLFWVIPFVGVGITPDFTLGGGLPPWGGDLREMPAWIAPKLRIHHQERFQVAVGAFAIRVPGEWRDDCDSWLQECAPASAASYGIVYSVGTWGTDDTALHAGAGVAFGPDIASGYSRLPVMIGGEHRLGRRWKLLSENWLIPGELGAASIGFRRIGERWTWDLGWLAIAVRGEEELPFFPMVSFSYSWGR
jgi:hypothetical protein